MLAWYPASKLVGPGDVANQRAQLSTQDRVTEERGGEFVIPFDHCSPVLSVLNDLPDSLNNRIGQQPVDGDHVETARLNVGDKDRVAVHDDWFAKVKRLQQSVSKSLVGAEIRHNVRVWINVLQRVPLLTVLVNAAHVTDTRVHKSQVDSGGVSHVDQRFLIVAAFVAGVVRDDKFESWFVDFRDETDRLLDSFSRNDPRGLQDEDV